MKKLPVDKIFLTLLIILSIIGLFVFTSASLGLLVDGWNGFEKIIIKQILMGLIFGWIALVISSNINYKKWNAWSRYIFGFSVFICLLVFIPGIGIKAGGAKSWIDLGFITFQPSEILKFTFVVFFASFLTNSKEKITDFKKGFLLSLGIIGIPTILLLAQPDMGTLFSIVCASLTMFLIAGGKKRHLLIFLLLGIVMVFTMAYLKPHVLARLKTFMDPMKDQQGSGYQIKQSLIAIGSGGLTGRGFGQSIQKFTFLPEAIGDSVFSVASEEFGFIGSSVIVLLFLFFGLRGLKIAGRAPDTHSRLTVVGIVTLVVSQSFLNIGAMLSILPLTGVPLIFLSHGGTALSITLFEMGVILNISKYQKN